MWMKAVELTRERRWVQYLASLARCRPARIPRRAVTSAEPIQIAFVGMGRHATLRLLPAIAALPRFKRCTTDLDDVLRDPAIQAVVVAVPTSISAQIAARCLAAGLHVYCECPAALSECDIRMLDRAAVAGGNPVFQVGYQLRAIPRIQTLAGQTRSSAEPWILEISFHSVYHLCDLVSFFEGDPQVRYAAASGPSDVKLVFASGHTVRIVLKAGPLGLNLTGMGHEAVSLKIDSGGASETYQNMFLNFEASLRECASPLCGLADLKKTFSIYRTVCALRVRRRLHLGDQTF